MDTRGPFQLDSVLSSYRLWAISIVVRSIPANWTCAPSAANGPRVSRFTDSQGVNMLGLIFLAEMIGGPVAIMLLWVWTKRRG